MVIAKTAPTAIHVAKSRAENRRWIKREILRAVILNEGQEVEIPLEKTSESPRVPGEGFLRTEGALADDTEWDAIMEEIYQSRKVERPTAEF